MKKIGLTLLALIIIANIGYAYYIKHQFVYKTSEEIGELSYMSEVGNDEIIGGDFIVPDSLSSLEEASQIIAKIEILDQEKVLNQGLIHYGKVITCDKGDLKVGDTISIYEPVMSFFTDQVDFYGYSLPFHFGDTYYVYLNPTHSHIGGYIVSSLKYSKYNLSHDDVKVINKNLSLRQMAEYDLYSNDEKEIQLYTDFYNQVKQK